MSPTRRRQVSEGPADFAVKEIAEASVFAGARANAPWYVFWLLPIGQRTFTNLALSGEGRLKSSLSREIVKRRSATGS